MDADVDWPTFARALVAALVYATVGVILFTLVYLVVISVTPFSLKEELVDRKNVPVAIVLASVILGLSHIIAAAISS